MIRFLRKRASLVGVSAAAAAILLSACSQAAGSGSPGAYPTARATSGPGSASPSASPSNGAAQVGTWSVPEIGTVLADSKGLTLYHLTTDTSTKITCSGTCAQAWPPLLAKNGIPTSFPRVSGSFGTIKRPDGGAQVTFNGMPLYSYSGDSQAGQATGQGIGGVWFAVTP